MLWENKLELVVVTCHTDENEAREECHPYWKKEHQKEDKFKVWVKSYTEENSDGIWIR